MAPPSHLVGCGSAALIRRRVVMLADVHRSRALRRQASSALAPAIALIALLASARAQDQEVAGRVTDERGTAIAGADVTFLPLPVDARPRAGSKGRYRLAQAAHRATTKLPRTRTDRDGTFRCMLSPQLAALAAGSGVEMAMRVSAPSHLTWMRAIGERLEGADGVVAVLPRTPPNATPRLRLRVATAVDGAYQGFALIERAYRARPDRSVWLRHLAPLSNTGEVEYDEPARLPGEVGAGLPTARAEGYRVTLYVAGLDRWQRTLTEGAHEVRPERSDLPPRRVLAERGELARTPIEATYELAGEEVTVSLGDPRVPLLGGETPLRVHSASGPVAVDAWDPDLPLFVDNQPAPQAKVEEAGAPTPVPTRAIDLAVVDRRGTPLFGAAAWLEDSVARAMLPAGRPYAISDPRGTPHLTDMPPGMHWLLVRHATAGEREVLLDTTQAGPLQVVLRPAPVESATENAVVPGSLLLDLGPATAADDALEVGVLQVGGRMLSRGFPERPRLVRLEGLTPGPATVWARVGDGAVHILAGVLATSADDGAVHPLRATAKTFVLSLRTHEGKAADGAYLSLGEGTPKGKKPFTTDLLPLTIDATSGRATLTLRLIGDLWVVAHGAQGERRDVLLQSDGGAPVIEVALPAPEPPPPPKETLVGPPVKKDDGGK